MTTLFEILLIGIPSIIILMKLFAAQYVNELVKRLFNGRSDKKAFATFYIALFLSFMLGVFMTLNSYKEILTETQEIYNEEEPLMEKDTLFIEQDRPKTDKEVELEMIQEGIETTGEIIESIQNRNQQLKDSKGDRLVYQVGDLVDNEKILFKKFKKLREIPTLNTNFLKVFKIKRNQFLIIYDLHQSEDEMNEGLSDFKTSLSSIENNIIIRELNQECRARQEIVKTKPLDRRKFDFKITCLECG